jgi:hypothetical protein
MSAAGGLRGIGAKELTATDDGPQTLEEQQEDDKWRHLLAARAAALAAPEEYLGQVVGAWWDFHYRPRYTFTTFKDTLRHEMYP